MARAWSRPFSSAPYRASDHVFHRRGRTRNSRLSHERQRLPAAINGSLRHTRILGGRSVRNILSAGASLRTRWPRRIARGGRLRHSIYRGSRHSELDCCIRRVRNRGRAERLSASGYSCAEPLMGDDLVRSVRLYGSWLPNPAHKARTNQIRSVVLSPFPFDRNRRSLANVSAVEVIANSNSP